MFLEAFEVDFTQARIVAEDFRREDFAAKAGTIVRGKLVKTLSSRNDAYKSGMKTVASASCA